MLTIRVVVEIPALDRILDQIGQPAKIQAELDALTQRMTNLSGRLKAALNTEEKGL